MSFPRANIKRFNETSGCAPPPGSYDPKINDKATGGVVDKTDRFKVYKDLSSTSFSTASSNNTPVKQLFGGAQNIKKPPKAPAQVDNGMVKELEKEIRQLVKERNDKDKLLTVKEEELKRLDGRLHIVQLERTGLLAKMATAEKELKDTHKSIELLKSKLATSETVYKKYEEIQIELSTLKQQLTYKDKEILKLKEDLNMAVKALDTCVDTSDSLTNSLEENIATYRNMIQKLCEMPNDNHCEKTSQRQEDINDKLHDDTVSVDEKLKICKKKSLEAQQRFHVAIKELNSLSKILQTNYTKVIEDNLKLKQEMARVMGELKLVLSLKSSMEQHRDNLLDTNSNLQDQLKFVDVENKTAAEKLRTLSETIDNLHIIRRNLELQLQDMETKHQELLNTTTERICFLEEREITARQATV